jgi:hypothetical protein
MITARIWRFGRFERSDEVIRRRENNGLPRQLEIRGKICEQRTSFLAINWRTEQEIVLHALAMQVIGRAYIVVGDIIKLRNL